jgi:methylglutaconyl-CoA hydratase
MGFKTLKLEFDGEIATITLNRPERRNALSSEMIEELLRALDEIEKGPARVGILTGAGKAFCAGMDLEDMRNLASLTREEHQAAARRMAEMFRRVYTFPKPLISAVNGPAIAGGTGLATLPDFTLAAPEAKFGYTEVRIGFIPAVVSVFLRRQVGEKRARELLLTGRIFDAEEAQRIGLVTTIVPAQQLLDAARHRAVELCVLSPSSLARTKRLLCEAEKAELERDLDAAIRESAEIRLTHDYREGVAAFLEKRKPEWRGE